MSTWTMERLNRLKGNAAKRSQTWQAYWRETAYKRYQCHHGSWQALESMERLQSTSDRAYYLDSFDNFRNVQDAHEAYRGIEHTGWYCDDYQDSLAIGVVMQLPSRDDCEYWIPGIRFTGSYGVTCFPLDSYEDVEDCARAADHSAERFAESEREYQAIETAKFQIEEARDTIVSARSERRKLVAAIRETSGNLGTFTDSTVRTVCDSLRSRIRGLKRESAAAFQQIEKLEDEFGGKLASQ